MLIWKLAKRAGVEFSWHDARRYVETALEEAKINPNWCRKIRGRKIRGEENPYSKPAIEQLRTVLKEVVPKLQFLSAPAEVNEEERRVQATYDHLRLTGFSEDEIEAYKKQRGKTWKTARDLIRIVRLRKWKPAENRNQRRLPERHTL